MMDREAIKNELAMITPELHEMEDSEQMGTPLYLEKCGRWIDLLCMWYEVDHSDDLSSEQVDDVDREFEQSYVRARQEAQ